MTGLGAKVFDFQSKNKKITILNIEVDHFGKFYCALS